MLIYSKKNHKYNKTEYNKTNQRNWNDYKENIKKIIKAIEKQVCIEHYIKENIDNSEKKDK